MPTKIQTVTATDNGTASTYLDVTISAPTPGNVLIFSAGGGDGWGSGASITDTSNTPLAGVVSSEWRNNDASLFIGYMEVPATPESTYRIQYGGTNYDGAGFVVEEWSGLTVSGGYHAGPSQSAITYTTDYVTAAISSTAADCLFIATGSVNDPNGGTSWTTAAGWTETADINGGGHYLFLAHRIESTATTVGPDTFTLGGNNIPDGYGAVFVLEGTGGGSATIDQGPVAVGVSVLAGGVLPPYPVTVQRGTVADFGAGEDTAAGTLPTPLGSLASGFIRQVSSMGGGSGPTAQTTSNRNNDDIGLTLNMTTAAGFAYERQAAGVNEDIRFYWEAWDNAATTGGNEWLVVDRGEITLAAGAASNSSVAVAVTNAAQCVAIMTGHRHTGAGRTYDQAKATLDRTADTGATCGVTATRGDSTGDLVISYVLVEFTGANWTVEKYSHTFTAAGTNEPVTLSGNTPWGEKFILNTHRTSGQGLDETGVNVWPGGSNTEMLARLRSGAGTGGQAVVGYVVHNAELVVAHADSITGGESEIGTGANTNAVTIPAVGSMDAAGVLVSADCSGTGTAYPRQFWTAELTSTTTVSMWRARNGQASDFSIQVIDFSGLSFGTTSSGATIDQAPATVGVVLPVVSVEAGATIDQAPVVVGVVLPVVSVEAGATIDQAPVVVGVVLPAVSVATGSTIDQTPATVGVALPAVSVDTGSTIDQAPATVGVVLPAVSVDTGGGSTIDQTPATVGVVLPAVSVATGSTIDQAPATVGVVLPAVSVATGSTIDQTPATVGVVLPVVEVIGGGGVEIGQGPVAVGVALPAVSVDTGSTIDQTPATVGVVLPAVSVATGVVVDGGPVGIGVDLPAVEVYTLLLVAALAATAATRGVVGETDPRTATAAGRDADLTGTAANRATRGPAAGRGLSGESNLIEQ